MQIEQIRQQAQDENTSSATLTKLATNKDRLTRQYAASNPNTPLEILEKLSKEFPAEILANPILDLLLLENPKNIRLLILLERCSPKSAETWCNLENCESADVWSTVEEYTNQPDI